MDNIRWAEASVVLPPPTMSVDKTVPGLNLLAASGGRYDRQNIVTVAPDSFGWIGSSTPLSHSRSIKSFPSGATYGGFTTHSHLVPGTPGTEEYPDWNEANCILVDIGANADESGTITFHYKTNAPGSNGVATLDGKSSPYFNTQATSGPVGQLGSVTGASILGTWTLTLSQDTQITLTAPDGSSTNLVMPPEDATLFAEESRTTLVPSRVKPPTSAGRPSSTAFRSKPARRLSWTTTSPCHRWTRTPGSSAPPAPPA